MEEANTADALLVDEAALSNMIECLFGTHNTRTTISVPIYYRTMCIINTDDCVTMNILKYINVTVRVPKYMLKPFFLYKTRKNTPEFKLIWSPNDWTDSTPPVFCTKRKIPQHLLTSHIEDNEIHLACSVEHSVF